MVERDVVWTEPKDHYIIAFVPGWQIAPTPVHGPFTRGEALKYQANWQPIPNWAMKVVRVIDSE